MIRFYRSVGYSTTAVVAVRRRTYAEKRVLYGKSRDSGGGGREGAQNKPRKIIHSEFRWETTKPGRGNRININLVRTQSDPESRGGCEGVAQRGRGLLIPRKMLVSQSCQDKGPPKGSFRNESP